jgi:hypothetical protein
VSQVFLARFEQASTRYLRSFRSDQPRREPELGEIFRLGGTKEEDRLVGCLCDRGYVLVVYAGPTARAEASLLASLWKGARVQCVTEDGKPCLLPADEETEKSTDVPSPEV